MTGSAAGLTVSSSTDTAALTLGVFWEVADTAELDTTAVLVATLGAGALARVFLALTAAPWALICWPSAGLAAGTACSVSVTEAATQTMSWKC